MHIWYNCRCDNSLAAGLTFTASCSTLYGSCNRLAAGWLQGGYRLVAGWMQVGCRVVTGWLQGGCRVVAG